MSLDRLKLTPKPVNGEAVRVVFFRGEHYVAPVRSKGAVRRHTWRYPPRPSSGRPNDESDFTGVRNGSMVALYWYRPGKGSAIWIAKCDCGNYEIRRPALWSQDAGAWSGRDRCEFCRDRSVATKSVDLRCPSHINRRARFQKWVGSMLRLGLTRAEIIRIMQIGQAGNGFLTTGKSVDEIRAELRLHR